MWFLSLDMAATASSWERNSTSASPVDLPLGATSMWTLSGFKGEKNYTKKKKKCIHRLMNKDTHRQIMSICFFMTINIQCLFKCSRLLGFLTNTVVQHEHNIRQNTARDGSTLMLRSLIWVFTEFTKLQFRLFKTTQNSILFIRCLFLLKTRGQISVNSVVDKHYCLFSRPDVVFFFFFLPDRNLFCSHHVIVTLLWEI